MTLKFKEQQRLRSDIYRRWESECGTFAIAWFKYYSRNGGRFETKPHYRAYRSSMSVTGNQLIDSFDDAVEACERNWIGRRP